MGYWTGRYERVKGFLPPLQFFAVPSWDAEAQAFLDDVAVMPLLEPGDLIIWYSDLVHGSIPPIKESEASSMDDLGLRRLAALVTMTPRYKASARVLDSRKRAVCDNVTT